MGLPEMCLCTGESIGSGRNLTAVGGVKNSGRSLSGKGLCRTSRTDQWWEVSTSRRRNQNTVGGVYAQSNLAAVGGV